MSYSLNTSVCTRKVTLASTGPYCRPFHNPYFILLRPLLFDDRLMHICGVENVIVRHPTYFHEKYRTEDGYYVQKDGTESEPVSFDATNFNAFLNGVYAQPKFLSIGLIDNILWSLFKFLQGFVQDDGKNIFFTFNGFQTLTDYWHKGKAWNDATTVDLNDSSDNLLVRKRLAILTSLYQSGSFKFNILLKGDVYSAIHLEGPLLNLFGLDST